MVDWYPEAYRIIPKHVSGLKTIDSPPKILLHSTESYDYQPSKHGGRENYFGHQGWPHFTGPNINLQMFQHFSLSVGARALKNLSGGIETNRLIVIQFEIPWKAAEIHLLPKARLDVLKKAIFFVSEELDVPRVSTVEWVPYPESYGFNARQRLTKSETLNYTGILGHQHFAENDHGDPGNIDIEYLLSEEEDEMTLPKDWVKFVQPIDSDGKIDHSKPVYCVNLLTEEIDPVEPGKFDPHAVRWNFRDIFGVDPRIHPVDPMFIEQFRLVTK